jgi:hypothetical protein
MCPGCYWNFVDYVGVVNPTIVALNVISTQQASSMQQSMERVKQLLDFVSSQEEAVLMYNVSDMVLAIHSDAAYLNESKAQS